MKIIANKTEEFFSKDTPLMQANEHGGRNYEERPQQKEMAVAVANALINKRHLTVEAPTGVGKSFAYLIPAIYHAIYTATRVVISTHTISLQEQLINKDIAILKKIIPQKFEAVIAKGRENYVCLRRLEQSWQQPESFLFEDEQLTELNRIKMWSLKTQDGSRSDLVPMPEIKTWRQVCCEQGNCQGQRCHHFERCFLMRMKMNLANANVIITNHSLFFVDLAIKNDGNEEKKRDGILPKFSAVVFDEAHTIEECAAMHLGLHISSGGMFHILNRLFLPSKDEKHKGLLGADRWVDARTQVQKLRDKSEIYFDQLTQWVHEQKDNPLRYTSPGHIENYIHPELCDLDEALRTVIEFESSEANKQELQTLKDRLYDYNVALGIFLEMSEKDFVYWFETKEYAQERYNLSFYGVPVEVNKVLSSLLFGQEFTVIMTSATLAVNKNLQYFSQRIGAYKADSLILDSPFDYEKQVEIHIPQSIASPKDDAKYFIDALSWIKKYIKEQNGRTMVLFTSYFMMQKMAKELENFFRVQDITLLMQGERFSNSYIIEQFKSNQNSVIFGTSSFWTGVDIAGDALSTVIIVRIPFSVPSYPLNQARTELIEQRGGNSFNTYTLPEAILRFRQGFGRLIRSKSDHGCVVLLDSRVITTNYGRQILDSLPKCQLKLL